MPGASIYIGAKCARDNDGIAYPTFAGKPAPDALNADDKVSNDSIPLCLVETTADIFVSRHCISHCDLLSFSLRPLRGLAHGVVTE